MKILMVCLGNICRSPLAHGILQHLVNQQNLGWSVESAGTGDWHIGCPPDKRSVAVAEKFGVDISSQRARHFEPSFFDIYDCILVMDNQNYKDVIAQAPHSDLANKVSLFLKEGIVPDPYFDESLFEPVYQMIEKRCLEIIEEYK